MNIQRPYLSTADLSVGYRRASLENRLFEDLNVALRGGEMICFMGPNGAGKSSLLRTLAGLQQPLAGKVNLHAGSPTENISHQIAVVLTDRINAANLTVEDILNFGRYPYLGWSIHLNHEDKRIIQRSVEQVQVGPLLKKRLYELSDGQLQMVMIARALAQDTPTILLDEPTAHLDLNNRLEIMNLLRQLSRSMGKAILLATHELDLALQTADLIWLTGNKRNIISGLPEDLVLNGIFDEIFRFKGFDLQTGKVVHDAFRNKAIDLRGEGPAYLWTKNALERNGYTVVRDESAEISITLVQELPKSKWLIKKNNSVTEADSLEKLMNSL
jgi:iron complex transport system ATP-binding protein